MTKNLKKMLSAMVAIIMLVSFATTSICSAAEVSATIKREDNSIIRVNLDSGTSSSGNKVFTYSDDDFSCDAVFTSVFTVPDAAAIKSISFQADNSSFEKTNNTVKAYGIPGNVVNKNDYKATSQAINNSVQTELGSVVMAASGSGKNVEIPLDASLFEKCVDSNGKVTVIIRVENYNAKRTTVLGNTIGASTAIKLNIVYGSKDAQFYGKKSVSILGTNPIAIDADTHTTTAEITTSGLLDLRYNGNDNLLFMTFDLTGVDKDAISSVIMENAVYRGGGTQKIRVTEVTVPYSETDGSFTLSETSHAISSACPYQTFTTTTTTDLTDMIKNTTGNSITVCIQSEGTFTGRQQISVSNRYYQNPEIFIEYSNDSIENLDNISNYQQIVAERYVIKGSSDAPINAIPIIALYDGDQLIEAKIGSDVSLDGNIVKISESISVPAGLSNPKVSLFVWTSISECIPVLGVNSIE